MSRRSTTRVFLLAVVALGAVLVASLKGGEDEVASRTEAPRAAPSPASSSAARSTPAASSEPSDATPDPASADDDTLVAPTGRPKGLTCEQARSLVREVHERFATDVPAADLRAFVEGVTSWLDPHGLWSASADAPTGPLIASEARALLGEIAERPESTAPCAAAVRVGAALERWVGELARTFDAASAGAPRIRRPAAFDLASASAFEDGDVTVPARALAEELGRRAGSVGAAFGKSLAPFVRAARERFVPTLDARTWSHVVLAAAVRSYVGAVDPHGAWAPLDEEWSLYADDPSFDDDDRLWSDMLRTALGVRVVDEPTPPLELDDLVLSIQGVPTVGLSVEQVEQLSRAENPESRTGERSLVILRQGENKPRELVVEPDQDDGADGEEGAEDETAAGKHPTDDTELAVDFVPYGRGNAEVVTIRYVGDDLGERLADIVAEATSARRPPLGILLDLRGNGGGSTDGAAAALGVFDPGVPAFPLLNHGRVVEVLTTPVPPPDSRWRGPVATLVDGSTASAAEMLAGALDKYRRGPVLGQRTYGKGCVQEYFRDRVGAGVLRLTTRLYTLPDGSPVQRRGLLPDFFVGPEEHGEREADLGDALGPLTGPDVRVSTPLAPSWPPYSGRLGPCPDSVICAALRRAAGTPVARARPESPARKRLSPRPTTPASR